MSEKRCKFKEGTHNCGSYAFNLHQEGIDQGKYCDRHYWQNQCSFQKNLLDEQQCTIKALNACIGAADTSLETIKVVDRLRAELDQLHCDSVRMRLGLIIADYRDKQQRDRALLCETTPVGRVSMILGSKVGYLTNTDLAVGTLLYAGLIQD